MRWVAGWWGIVLVGEDEDDKAFLLDLQSRLPETPLKGETYEGGKLEAATDEEKGEFYLTFNR